MNNSKNNIFTHIPDQLPSEYFESLFKKDNLHIERIVSKGHTTPSGQWYDQNWDEWVLLLQGNAIIEYEDDLPKVAMSTGDYLLIPANVKHRVAWTDTDTDTIWLAVHLHKTA